MSSLSQFAGGLRVPKALVNSANGSQWAVPFTAGIKTAVTGALTSNTLSTVLSLTGSGVVNVLNVSSVDATSRTHRLKVTIDGTVVFDATSSAVTTANNGIAAIGLPTASGSAGMDQIPFNSSFLAEYASSLSETGKTNVNYLYRTN